MLEIENELDGILSTTSKNKRDAGYSQANENRSRIVSNYRSTKNKISLSSINYAEELNKLIYKY